MSALARPTPPTSIIHSLPASLPRIDVLCEPIAEDTCAVQVGSITGHREAVVRWLFYSLRRLVQLIWIRYSPGPSKHLSPNAAVRKYPGGRVALKGVDDTIHKVIAFS